MLVGEPTRLEGDMSGFVILAVSALVSITGAITFFWAKQRDLSQVAMYIVISSVGFGAGLVVLGFLQGSFAGFYTGYKAEHILIPFYAMSMGLGLYIFRRRAQVFYGVTELVIALLTTVTAAPGFMAGSHTSTLQLAGGLYLIVRGLTNIGDGLSPESRLRRIWDEWFPKGT